MTEPRRPLVRKLLARLTDPLVAILLIAALVSGLTGDWWSLVLIVVIVAFSIGLDIFQEGQAEKTVQALRKSVAVTTSVVRDGAPGEVFVGELVPGDVVQLRAGDLVPADGLILSSLDAMANEVLLTGEAYPTEKRAGLASGRSLTDAWNALFAGTALVAGDATMLVVATGGRTQIGLVAAATQASEPPTAFERGVHSLGLLILRLTGFLVLFVLLTQLARHGLTLESFMFAVALAVGLTPELLPMVMTVTLARGAARMAKRQVVVKRLSAIHDLGAMDVLCTDKTGTLTEASIRLVETFGADGSRSGRVAELARLNSRFVGGIRSSLDNALLADGAVEVHGWTRLDDAAFDFERRRSSVLLARGTERLMICKGAPEALLELCDKLELSDGKVVGLTKEAKALAAASISTRENEGFRLLGVAWRAMDPAQVSLAAHDEAGLVFAGGAAFLDPPKASASAAIERLRQAGVRVKIISGDAEAVVRHLVEMLGLPSLQSLCGDEIGSLDDASLAKRVSDVDLYVRVSPGQKRRIVEALRRQGHTVGFIGDGINDAPAIHAADVGLSVEGGTDVARAAADIVLLAPNLGVLADGIDEGRRTYANIMKYVRMGTSSNFGNMLSMAIASLVLPFLPLTPLQILLNNLIYDLSEVGIPFDGADPEDRLHPHAWNMREVLRFSLIMGPLSSIFDLATFALLRFGFEADAGLFQTAWFVESMVTQILVIFIIRTARRAAASRPHPILVATSLGALALAFSVALTPLGGYIGFVAMPADLLLSIAGLSAAYLTAAEFLKRHAVIPGAVAQSDLQGDPRMLH